MKKGKIMCLKNVQQPDIMHHMADVQTKETEDEMIPGIDCEGSMPC